MTWVGKNRIVVELKTANQGMMFRKGEDPELWDRN